MARVFVDMGSSVDIISLDCFTRMGLGGEFRPARGTIYGFTGGSIQPLG